MKLRTNTAKKATVKQQAFRQTEIGLIPKDWQVKKVGDFVDIKHGFAFKGEFFTDTPNEKVVLTPGNFRIGGGFKADKMKYTTETWPDEYTLKDGDIVVTMTDLSREGDTLGYAAKIPHFKGKLLLHNQRIGLLRFKSEVSKDFIYWVLRTKKYNNFVVSSATGSTVKHTSPNRIKEYEFGMPTNYSEQQQIANILSDFESKVKLNHELNKNLEAIVKAIFNHWFVDFEFPNEEGKPYKSSGGEIVDSEMGEIPRGWTITRIGDVLELAYGKALREGDRRNGLVPVFGSNGQVGWHNKKLVDGPGIVVGRKGNPGIVTLVQEAFFPIDTTFFVVPKGTICSIYYLYHALKGQDLPNLAADSAVPGLNRNIAYMNSIVIPSSMVLDAFDKLAFRLYRKVHLNLNQSQTLSSIRNALLPKLMSGQIRVKVSEKKERAFS